MLIVHLTIFFNIGKYLVMNLWIRRWLFFCNTAWPQCQLETEEIWAENGFFSRKTLRKSLSCLNQSQTMILIYYICLLVHWLLWFPHHMNWEFLWVVPKLPPTILLGPHNQPCNLLCQILRKKQDPLPLLVIILNRAQGLLCLRQGNIHWRQIPTCLDDQDHP